MLSNENTCMERINLSKLTKEWHHPYIFPIICFCAVLFSCGCTEHQSNGYKQANSIMACSELRSVCGCKNCTRYKHINCGIIPAFFSCFPSLFVWMLLEIFLEWGEQWHQQKKLMTSFMESEHGNPKTLSLYRRVWGMVLQTEI